MRARTPAAITLLFAPTQRHACGFAMSSPVAAGTTDPLTTLKTVLSETITFSGERVGDVFKKLDKDGSGGLSRKEFRRGIIELLGYTPEVSALNDLFDELDPEETGQVDYKQLNKALRRGASVELDASLQAGAAGEIETASTTKIALRKGKTANKSAFLTLGGIGGGGEDDDTVGELSSEQMQAALRDALKANATRIIDLFKEWDVDGDGQVSKAEFSRALPMLGLQVDAGMASSLFDAFDPDGSGDIGYKEFAQLLRSSDDAALQASIKKAAERNAALTRKAKPKLTKDEMQKSMVALRKGPMSQSTKLQGLDIKEGSEKTVAQQLREALSQNAMRIVDLFREWDEDGDGTIDKKEFRRAMPLIGFDVPRKEIDALFDEWDPDGSGTIELNELNKFLRRGNEVTLDKSLQAGGAGKIEMKSKTKHALRKGSLSQAGNKVLAGVRLQATADKSIQEQLRDVLTKHAVRVIDLFKEWDEDGDGTVSKKEFRKAVPALGLSAPRPEIDALFDSFDPDGSGSIEYAEFNKLLRRGQTMTHVTEAPPKPLWTGPLLGPKAMVYVFGPSNAPEKAALCRRLAHNFGGICLASEQLAEKEVEAASDLGMEIRQIQSQGNALPNNIVAQLFRQAVGKLRGPFILQDFPRTIAQLHALEERQGRQAALAIELKVPGRASGSDQPLVDEYERRGRMIQLKAHSDTLTLLKAVEDTLVSQKDRAATQRKEAAEAKVAAEAAGKRKRRAALEVATKSMEQARRAGAAAEAAALAARQREQFAAHKNRSLALQQAQQQRKAETAALDEMLRERARPPVEVAFRACKGGSAVVPGSHSYHELQQRWSSVHAQIDAASPEHRKGLSATARSYHTHVPVMAWKQKMVRSASSLGASAASLASSSAGGASATKMGGRASGRAFGASGMPRSGTMALPAISRAPPGDDPKRASFVNRKDEAADSSFVAKGGLAASASAPVLAPAGEPAAAPAAEDADAKPMMEAPPVLG